ncbi:hypothetical protein hamaS1_18990 [Moorella sp. Hama-1]|nr:hypothetical protein hamaS1_18990 [Moorella sp. Hama-1]
MNQVPDIQITINFNNVTVSAELNDSAAARRIQAALPFSSRVNTWGNEIYFPIPVKAELEQEATDVVEVGDIAYWPPGHSLCLFFGPTPVSHDQEPRAASPVNKVGRISSDINILKDISDGARVEIKKPEIR